MISTGSGPADTLMAAVHRAARPARPCSPS